MNKSIKELHELLKNKETTSEELIKESLTKSHEINAKYNAFVTILDNAQAKPITNEFLLALKIIFPQKIF